MDWLNNQIQLRINGTQPAIRDVGRRVVLNDDGRAAEVSARCERVVADDKHAIRSRA